MSTSKRNSRRPLPDVSEHPEMETSPQDLGSSEVPPDASPDVPADDPTRTSLNSAATSSSSTEPHSGTERSSILTTRSSMTDLSPDTPDGSHEKEDDMSVEDAIAMYLDDGFGDAPEEEEHETPDVGEEFRRRSARILEAMLASLPDAQKPPDPQPAPKTPNSPKSPQQTEKVIIPGVVPPPLLPGTDGRDRYGFRKATHYVTLAQYDAWHGPYSNFVEHRKQKWAELLKECGLPASDPTTFPPKSSKVKRYVRKGIPSEYRGSAWFFYAGGHEHLNQHPGHYEQLVQQAMESPTNDDKEHIERDLHRTFPDNIHFKPEVPPNSEGEGDGAGSSNPKYGSAVLETQMIQSLRRVLYAFSLHNPKIGYTQSLNFITGLLLLFLPEEKAFWMLHIITSEYLPGTHEISLEGANVDLWILMVLMKESLPAIYAKVSTAGSPPNRSKPPALTVRTRLPDITLGLTNWLMSIFIGSLPLETTLRVWDVFFYEGPKTFFRIALAIFKLSEKEILSVNDPMEVFQIIQTVPKKLLDVNALMEESFARRYRVGQNRIDSLREARRAAVREEKMRRSLMTGKGQAFAEAEERLSSRSHGIVDSLKSVKHHAFNK